MYEVTSSVAFAASIKYNRSVPCY